MDQDRDESESITSTVRHEEDDHQTDVVVADVEYPKVTLHQIAFGSCHNRKKALESMIHKKSSSNQQTGTRTNTIWDTIRTNHPNVQGFLWTGDAVYSPVKEGVASVDVLRKEYHELKDNDTSLGYRSFLDYVNSTNGLSNNIGVFGTWDDHDYGANDAGNDLYRKRSNDLYERQNAYLDFLDVPSNDVERRQHRKGVYSSVLLGSGSDHEVLIIMLDTRTHRDLHCIPSWAAIKIPYMGSIGGTVVALFSCVTRWLTAKILWHPWLYAFSNRYLCSSPNQKSVLGQEQWIWLEGLLQTYNNASAYIVVSSIQVLTTNPAPESWGHFDHDRTQLLKLLQKLPGGVILLSGDVHHAEILSSNTSSTHTKQKKPLIEEEEEDEIIEVTSSGLTHSVQDMGMVIAPLAKYQIDMFSTHRRRIGSLGKKQNVYIGTNYGTIDFHWPSSSSDDEHDSSHSHNAATSDDGSRDEQRQSSYMKVNVHDENGTIVLNTDEIATSKTTKRDIDVDAVPKIFQPTKPIGATTWKDNGSNLGTLVVFVLIFMLLPTYVVRACVKMAFYCASKRRIETIKPSRIKKKN